MRKNLAPIILLILATAGCGSKTPVKKIDKSPYQQQGRAHLIQDLTHKGVFAKIEESPESNSIRLWVTKGWYALDYDDKESCANIVYSYYFDGSSVTDRVLIIDATSGKRIGQYSLSTGGLHLNQ